MTKSIASLSMLCHSFIVMKLCTIGYEGASLPTFLAALKQNGVEAIIDVRQNPISRKPGFSKTALCAALLLDGFEYLHMRDFGAPRAVRTAYKLDGDWKQDRRHDQNDR